MNKRFTEGLTLLASHSLQLELIAGGTVDHYLVPEEVIDSVITEARRLLSLPSGLSRDQRESVQRFARIAHHAYSVTLEHDFDSLHQLIDGEEWSLMRTAARECLNKVIDATEQSID